jgi:hypothetical protein
MIQIPGAAMDMHFEGHPTGEGLMQFILHSVDTVKDLFSGRAGAEGSLSVLPSGDRNVPPVVEMEIATGQTSNSTEPQAIDCGNGPRESDLGRGADRP